MRKLIGVLLVAMILCGLPNSAFSWEGHYHYRNGHYFRDAGWWGFGGFVTGLAVGAYVTSLPPRYETVFIDGVPYYYADGYYYQAGPAGYVVVSPPASQGQPGPTGNIIVYILAILFGIVLLLCIGLLLKKLLVKEGRIANG